MPWTLTLTLALNTRQAQRGELELGALSAEHAAEIEAEKARQAAAHERRIEHLTQLAARRLGKRELTLGWQTWLEMWQIKSRQMRQMRAVQATAHLKRYSTSLHRAGLALSVRVSLTLTLALPSTLHPN